MQEALGEGKSILQAYVEKVTLQPITAKVLYIEKLLRLDMGPFILMGRVDRVDEHEDGTLEIIDYKSGRLEVTPEDVQCDLAMGCYQLLLKSMHPEANVIGTIIALRSGNQASYAMSTKELEEFRNDILAIGTEIIHRDFEHHVPVWKDICPECDFLSLCKKHPEFVIPSEDQTTPTET
jgi:ATP-dependent helicase/DNAse subunit B